MAEMLHRFNQGAIELASSSCVEEAAMLRARANAKLISAFMVLCAAARQKCLPTDEASARAHDPL
jgi:hypothetical protein